MPTTLEFGIGEPVIINPMKPGDMRREGDVIGFRGDPNGVLYKVRYIEVDGTLSEDDFESGRITRA